MTKLQTTMVTIKAKCTSCKQTYQATETEVDAAKDFGCLFSQCCSAPATLESVSVGPKKKKHEKESNKSA